MHTFWLLLAACSTDYELKPGPVDVNPGDVTACGFTRVEDSAFYRYDCNPVFSVAATGDSWAGDIGSVAFAVTEVLDHPFYQAWYVGAPSASVYGDYGIGYAVSPNGADWESHPANPLLEEEPKHMPLQRGDLFANDDLHTELVLDCHRLCRLRRVNAVVIGNRNHIESRLFGACEHLRYTGGAVRGHRVDV